MSEITVEPPAPGPFRTFTPVYQPGIDSGEVSNITVVVSRRVEGANYSLIVTTSSIPSDASFRFEFEQAGEYQVEFSAVSGGIMDSFEETFTVDESEFNSAEPEHFIFAGITIEVG